ncbi:hypothetical protein EB259_03090, partial [Salmonella enterica]|nr:hypothetical protein [Salmonella enterica]
PQASTNTQNPAYNNQLKNQQDTPPSISTLSPLFCAFAQKIKISNKLNHLSHQLQGRQQIKQEVT